MKKFSMTLTILGMMILGGAVHADYKPLIKCIATGNQTDTMGGGTLTNDGIMWRDTSERHDLFDYVLMRTDMSPSELNFKITNRWTNVVLVTGKLKAGQTFKFSSTGSGQGDSASTTLTTDFAISCNAI
jgi:hypothetical protein